MANKTFSDFTNQPTPLGSDYVVGYRGSSEQRYTLSIISGLIAGAGLSSPLTTVGDIWGYNGTDARIPVGSNGEVLVADATEALGVKWAATGQGGLWSANGDKIYYNTDNVGIGTSNPQALLHVSGDYPQIFLDGPAGQSKYLKFNHSDGLSYIGADESLGAFAVIADNDLPLYIGQVSHQAIRVDYHGGKGRVVIGDDASRPPEGDEVLTIRNTGSSKGPTVTLQNNTVFGGDLGIRYEHALGMNSTSWMQGRYDSDDSFRLAFSGGADAILGVGDKLIVATGGTLLPGSSGSQNLGSVLLPWATGYLDNLYVNGVRITGNGGAGGDSSPLTTKGDLYGFTTENARIGTGVNGQVLTVDSTEAAGVAWADSAAGCPVTSWTEAFEEDAEGNLTPVTSNCVNDTMWMLNSDNSLSLRANHFRYVNGSNPYTEEVSF
jgi:hypothetical protein